MTAILQSQIFFFISSIGFVILWVLAAMILVYVLRALKVFSRTLERVEKDIDSIGDTSKEMLEDMRDSSVFRFLFQGKRKKRSQAH